MIQHTWPPYKNEKNPKICKISAVYGTLSKKMEKEETQKLQKKTLILLFSSKDNSIKLEFLMMLSINTIKIS